MNEPNESRALQPYEATQVTVIPEQDVTLVCGNDLVLSGDSANYRTQQGVFIRYHEECSSNTQRRQQQDIMLFARYLETVAVYRSGEELFSNPWTWQGVTYGHLQEFLIWQRDQGYAIGSINVRLATVRKYCSLAYQSSVITPTDWQLIQTVKGYSRKKGINIDESRDMTRVGVKKATPTIVSKASLRALRRATTNHERSRRDHDKALASRDALLIALLTEHALRCSEIAALDIESFDIEREEITVIRKKTKTRDVYPLMPRSADALAVYLDTQGRTTGPLFLGYGNKRISTRTINARIQQLGEAVGLDHLSPHDLRHSWTVAAFRDGNSIDVIQAYGGWSSAAMPLHYAKTVGVKHQRLTLTD